VDHEHTAGLYARSRVADYWVVDLAGDALGVRRDPDAWADAPHGWRDRTVLTWRPPATVMSLATRGTPIPVADLWP